MVILLQAPVRWPVILYAGLVVAAPYLMWRLVASLNTRPHPTTTHQQEESDTLWQEGEGEHFIAKERVLFCLIGHQQKIASRN
jgi:hypothetical protein